MAGQVVIGICDFQGRDDNELSFAKGDVFTLLPAGSDTGWAEAVFVTGQRGMVPTSFVEPYDGPLPTVADDDKKKAGAGGAGAPQRSFKRMSMMFGNKKVRARTHAPTSPLRIRGGFSSTHHRLLWAVAVMV